MGNRVLIVDDDPTLGRVMCRMLQSAGIEADSVLSGESALEKLSQNGYDLVFLDLRMPGLDGVETLRLIRESNLNLTVYISTGFRADYMDSLREAASDGLDFEVVEKPINKQKLMSIVDDVLLREEKNA